MYSYLEVMDGCCSVLYSIPRAHLPPPTFPQGFAVEAVSLRETAVEGMYICTSRVTAPRPRHCIANVRYLYGPGLHTDLPGKGDT